ncbi:MAG: FtsW/RodA/SpoVE family cell cycle protein [Chloroflexi bacterium]|nr:FtsW/RodA/SpoVE family cell cycle protein [Chloroflexota bacterium]
MARSLRLTPAGSGLRRTAAPPAARRHAARWRWRELALLLAAVLPALVGAVLLSVVWERPLDDTRFWPIYGFLGLVLASHLVLVAARFRGDQVLLPLAGAIAGLGMLLVTRLAPALAPRQFIWAVLGTSLMLAVAIGPWETRLLERYKYSSAAAGMILVALTLLFGIDPNGSGARLWLGTRSLAFQPSEILKVLLVVFLAGYLVEKRELLTTHLVRWGPFRLPPFPYLAPLLAMWALALALLVWQRDLGAAILFFGVFLVMLYVAVGQAWYVAAGSALFLGGGAVCYALFAHVRLRVEIWLDPWLDPQGRSYQVVQALYALGSGGLLGAGLGNGYPLYVPAVHTDFPFVALAEEGGLASSLALLLLYALLVSRGLQLSLRARLPFNRLLATGLTAVLAVQTMVIIGGNLKLVPLTGVTLPFVSYGGSSLLANFLILGVLLRMSHEEAELEERT